MLAAHPTPNADDGQADLLVLGRALTLDPARPRTRALAIRAGRVVALGREAARLRGPTTLLLDCGTRTILPGFVDAHLHLLALAATMLDVDCAGARSVAEVQALIARAAALLPAGCWVRASGYREERLAERRHPTRWELDAAAPAHPVRLRHATRHASVLSSRALALAGIGAQPGPSAGFVAREPATGEPTGLVVGLDAWLSGAVVPRRSPEELAGGVAAASARLLSAGVTSAQDLTPTNTLGTFEQMRRWQARGQLGVRVTVFTGAAALAERIAIGALPGIGDPWLTWGGVKLLLSHAGGRLDPPLSEISALVREAQGAGFPVALHAVEPEEVVAAADGCAAARGAGPLPWPHRIEHAAVCPPPLPERIAAADAAVVTQPGFVYWRGDRYQQEYSRQFWEWLYRLRGFLRAGVVLAAGSDAPVVPPEPLAALRAAVTRGTEVGAVLGGSERLALGAALPLFTRTPALLGGTPDRGHLAPGALADLAVLEGRLADVAHRRQPLPRVWLTLRGGAVAYAAPEARAILAERRTAR